MSADPGQGVYPEGTYLTEREPDIWLGGSGVRLTKYQKRRIRDYCLKRDGLKCMICLRDEPNPQNLQIHHKDHHAENHHASNLCLAHVDCNTKAHHGKVGTQLSYPAKR